MRTPCTSAAGMAAAPWMAERAACAALVSAALKASPGAGTTVVAFTARSHFANDGAAFLRVSWPGAELVDMGDAGWQLPVKYAHTPVETVAMSDVAALEQRLVAWLGGAR